MIGIGLILLVGLSKSQISMKEIEEGREAGSVLVVGLTQYLLQMIQTMMVGHIGTLALSSAAIATSVMGAAGFSIIVGLASALETQLGQANGMNERKIGIHINSAIISLNLVCLPLSIIFFFSGKLLTSLGQDPLISLEAGKYARWLIPALFAYATLQAQMRYLVSQSVGCPLHFSSIAHPLFHALLCWVLVFKSGLGYIGAAIALSLSLWFTVIFFALYIKYSSSCETTRAPLSKEAIEGIVPFFRLGIPSTPMVCLEWWSFELLILLSGLLPNPQLETSVLSICYTTVVFILSLPAGFGSAVSTRVSIELGAGDSKAARSVVLIGMLVSVTVAGIISVCLFASRNVLGHAFSNEKEVRDYVTEMIPLMCIWIIMGSIQGVLSGLARGSGWLHLSFFVNVGAFYLVGIPTAYVFGFRRHWGGKGLWIGILTGTVVQTVVLSIIAKCTNWQQQLQKSKERASS